MNRGRVGVMTKTDYKFMPTRVETSRLYIRRTLHVGSICCVFVAQQVMKQIPRQIELMEFEPIATCTSN